jgi:hypothetical protein
LSLQNGTAQFVVSWPPAGAHHVLIAYAAQTNYAAAKSVNESFTVTNAPVVVQLTPSTSYLTGGNLTLTAAIQSWSAGPPNQIGSVAFSDGNKVIATVPVSASGTATTIVAASSLSNGTHTIRASYTGARTIPVEPPQSQLLSRSSWRETLLAAGEGQICICTALSVGTWRAVQRNVIPPWPAPEMARPARS